uniref:Uncharacterized protein n=1 Tax=viral metagenome TaxID=1070528 RepID=A0A6C0AYA5_9ZZZZ|tara:strand:+ start:16627 stop:22323 length:5697 start_codon:yes stop_codon:yes gene_type:complete
MVDSPNIIINIQLGDILNIIAPTNNYLNNQQFYVKYIDLNKINLINSNNLNVITLILEDDGQLQDKSIESIELLSRSPFPGYAKQNNLVSGTWIDIHFGGEVPSIITGEITDLEQDMIEIRIYPNNNIIYIDFEYKGIPEKLPIEQIIIRNSPLKKTESDLLDPMVNEYVFPDKKDKDESKSSPIDPDWQIESPEIVEPQLKEILLDADQIQFGIELDEITHIVDVPEGEKRFDIEKQTNDLLDELLSDIPKHKRTLSVLNNIHKIIDRYQQLRTFYSDYDEYGNANMPKPIDESYKPIIKFILELKKKFHWLIPVSYNKKKLYDIDKSILEGIDTEDIDPILFEESIISENDTIEMYKNSDISDDENKYKYLFKLLNKFFTPFTYPVYTENGLTTQEVNANILSIVNNLGDLYSSVASNDTIQRKQFLIETYTKGLTYLKDNNIVPLTKNDNISIRSFLMLPLPVILFSRIDLPTTNILERAELNNKNINYWQFFNKNIDIRTVIIDNFKEDPDFSFLSTTEYILDEQLWGDAENYEKYLNSIIPNTESLFNLLNKYIKNKYSFYSIINFLEVFMIYHNNITFKQYQIINKFIEEEIIKYKENFNAMYKKYNQTISKKSPELLSNNLLQLLSSNKQLEALILDAYNLKTTNYSDSEFLDIIIKMDYGKLFATAITKITIELQTINLVDNFVQKYEQMITEKKELSNDCKTIVKKYTNREDLLLDSQPNKVIYIDSEYISKPNKKSEKIPIKNGDYAILEVIGETDTPIFEYFIRKNDEWIKDERTTENIGNMGETINNKLFCNLQENCINNNNSECVELNIAEHDINQQTLDAIYKEFNVEYGEKEEELRLKIDYLLQLNFDNIKYLKNLEKINFLKYDNIKKMISASIIDDDSVVISSPYENLKDLILGQSDLVKKQYDIQRFVLHFTREPFEHEDQYWLYCYKTNVKLLPSFLSHLANIYVSKGDYLHELDIICTKQGTISDDGDSWVDKYSGYLIKKIDLNNEEGFTEEGYRMRSREILEADLGDAVLKGKTEKPEKPEKTEETKKISNIISTITREMGINIDKQKDFIINNVIKAHLSEKPDKEDYEIKAKQSKEKGKKNVQTYEEVINLLYLILTFIFILVGIQISIPSIKSRKTFPGCIKSFTGYPFEGSDKSALIYISCIANKIKSSVEPWNSIKKLNESSIAKRMEAYIEKLVVKDQTILTHFIEKQEYLKTEIIDVKLLEFDTTINFLPPLQEFKITKLLNISDTFKSQLLENISTGSYFQHEQILTIQTKIIFFSLAIQEKIQKIVDKKTPLITNNLSEPFLENACCDDTSTYIHKYFIDNDKDLDIYNTIIIELGDILYDIKRFSTSSILFDPRDTKYKYPEVTSELSQDTIYRTFIFYCKSNTSFLSDELRSLCINNYDIYDEESTDKQIEKLKEEGITYSDELLQKLMNVINLKNEITLNLNDPASNYTQILRDILESVEYTDDIEHQLISEEFVNLFNNLLDTYSISLQEDTPAMRAFKNFLANSNDTMITNIEEFIKFNSKLSKPKFKQFQDCLRNITSFIESGNNIYIDSKDETIFKMINFIKNSINNIVDIFPNIILNKVNYSSINIPKHWKLSQRHINDIKDIVNKYYINLNQFYGDEELSGILKNIQNISKNIQLLCENTPFFSYIFTADTELYSIFDRNISILLYKYYFLKIIDYYILLLDDEDSIIKKDFIVMEEQLEEQLEEQGDDEITQLAINIGNKELLAKKLSNYIVSIMEIICNDKKNINYNYESIMEKILRSKEKEKDIITDFLQNLTDEEREIENIFKNQKLERWSKGLQKGLTQYVQENYDQEREAMEKQAIKEKKLGINSAVTDMNKDIYKLDIDSEEAIAAEIEAEAYDLDYLPEDDDYGDLDGDQ